ncbi:MAG: hypothetical protein GF408_04360, partial [Candidatus Omnitrophica bacterium]|nr:hypothetical protein [Candidatus Omnitrophota bacterium]
MRSPFRSPKGIFYIAIFALLTAAFAWGTTPAEAFFWDQGTTDEVKDEEKLKGYLERAGEYLEEKRYAASKRYAEQALKLDPGNEKAISILDEVSRAIKLEKEEEEARRRQALDKRFREYLSRSRRFLEEKDFRRARAYAKEALNLKEDPEPRRLLEEIDRGEKDYISAERRSSKEKVAKQDQLVEKRRREAEREARERAERQQRISGYLQKAQEYLDEGRYSRARSYAKRALNVEENEAAREMIARIGREESLAEEKERAEEEARRRARQEEERRREAEREARERAERQQRISGYLQKAQEYLD